MKKIFVGAIAIALFAVVGCGKYPGYKQSENGLYYKIEKKGKGDIKPKEGDLVKFEIVVRTEKGTIFFDSRKENRPIYNQVIKTMYKGDLSEAFWIFTPGDSGTFFVPSDSLIKYKQFMLPDSIKSNTMIYFDIRVDSLITKEQYEKDMAQARKQQETAMEEMSKQENDILTTYLTDNKISAKPTESGLYIITTKKGTGKKLTNGCTALVNYTGALINGKVFDTSIEDVAKKNNVYNQSRTYEAFAVEVGKGMVIAGWDEALLSMSVGQKAKLIIPSKIGYGERAMGDMIPPFSTLVFEIEVVGIK